MKAVREQGYNYNFNSETGLFLRWGESLKDDPWMSPLGPEIADIEISTICEGVGKVCSFCYKCNTPTGTNMTLETFEKVFANLPDNITQIAFGIGDVDSNPDMFAIFDHCRSNGVIPNVTINGARLTDEIVDNLVSVCGAIAVSRYEPKDVCYDAIKRLTDAGMKQVNIHQLVSSETYFDILELYDDMEDDPRLENLQATVLLSLKQKGRGVSMNRIEDRAFKVLVNSALDRRLSIGFDSCTANKFIGAIQERPEKDVLEMYSEPCESGLFSAYINVDGNFFPCSFTETGEGISVKDCDDFMKDVWFSEELINWRNRLKETCRSCPVYNV